MQRIKVERTALYVKVAKATLVSVMFINLILARISYADIAPETCVGLWTFDKEANVVKDLSGNENNGRLVNEPKWAAGKFNSALEFDGINDFVDCGNDASLNPESAVTILAWFKAEDLPSTYPRIVSKETTTTADPYNIMLRQSDSVVRFLLGDGSTEYGAGDFAISLGVWYHVAATYDGEMMRVYLDGTLSGTRALIFAIPDRTTSVLIGNNPSNNRQFNGTIDEVAIFNVALEEEDINEIMNDGLSVATGMSVAEPLGKLSTTWGGIKCDVSLPLPKD